MLCKYKVERKKSKILKCFQDNYLIQHLQLILVNLPFLTMDLEVTQIKRKLLI